MPVPSSCISTHHQTCMQNALQMLINDRPKYPFCGILWCPYTAVLRQVLCSDQCTSRPGNALNLIATIVDCNQFHNKHLMQLNMNAAASDSHNPAELKAAQATCQPDHPLADIAIVEVALGEANSLFTPIKPPPSEEPDPAPAVAPAPAAKAPAKGAAAKGPAGAAAKGPAKGAAAAAADQAPPLGAPELGRALELLGFQVQQYYAWREGAKVMHLPEEPISQDDLAGFKAMLQDAPQVCHQAFSPFPLSVTPMCQATPVTLHICH